MDSLGVHVTFFLKLDLTEIYIFRYVDQTGDIDDIQFFDSDHGSSFNVTGNPCCERSYHTNSIVIGDVIKVYYRGYCSIDPVSSRPVHAFDIMTCSQKTLSIYSPKPGQDCVEVAIDNKVYMQGRLSGGKFCSDIPVQNINKPIWLDVKSTKVHLSARVGHDGVPISINLYIFGGMNRDRAVDDVWIFDILNSHWTNVEPLAPPPNSRLDYSIYLIQLMHSLAVTDTPTVVMLATKQTKAVLDGKMSKPGNATCRSACLELRNLDAK